MTGDTQTTTAIARKFKDMRDSATNFASSVATMVPGLRDFAEESNTEILCKLADLEDEITETLSPASLYGEPASEGTTSEIVRIHSLIGEYEQRLATALQLFDDEVAKEAEMTMFRQIVFEFEYLSSATENFRETKTALKVVLFSHNTKVFSRTQIETLQKVLRLIKSDITMSDRTWGKVMDLLDDNFGLGGPFTEEPFIE